MNHDIVNGLRNCTTYQQKKKSDLHLRLLLYYPALVGQILYIIGFNCIGRERIFLSIELIGYPAGHKMLRKKLIVKKMVKEKYCLAV